MARTRWQLAALIALPVYWALLFTATHVPRVPMPKDIPHSDKVIHFGAFGMLAFLFWQFARARRGPIGDRFVWLAVAILIPYAALDEWLQQFVGRFTDLMDFIANTAGIVTTLTALEVHRRWRR